MNKGKGGFRLNSSFILPPSSFEEWSRSESNRDLDCARVASCQLDDGPIKKLRARCRIRTGDSTLARSRDGPASPIGQKKPRNLRGFRGRPPSKKPTRASPAQDVLPLLLLCALRTPTARVT